MKRAATSATRVAPLVMTMNCTAMMITKMINPITYPSMPTAPTTKVPKARTSFPWNWLPWERMSRVEETLRARPNTVAMSRRVGNTLNSSAWRV